MSLSYRDGGIESKIQLWNFARFTRDASNLEREVKSILTSQSETCDRGRWTDEKALSLRHSSPNGPPAVRFVHAVGVHVLLRFVVEYRAV